jgi:hypothetical protein
MSLSGWILMGLAWSVILNTTIICFKKVLSKPKKFNED